MKPSDYEIGGILVAMTPEQARAWNCGDISDSQCGRILAHDPTGDGRYLTLRRATNPRLEPVISGMLDGMPANATA